jgi:hypothetical protein
MIQLKPDCLIFSTADGQQIPCSAEDVTVELMGDSTQIIDPDIIRNAAAAVLHYFKTELKRDHVSVAEFSEALEKVLRSFGFNVSYDEGESGVAPRKHIVESDLRELACNAGKGCELFFFNQLREQMISKLEADPDVVRFSGLKSCVKQLVGVRRWTDRCQSLSDQIVEFLRCVLNSEHKDHDCELRVF